MTAILRTARLILRPWRDEDLEPFASMGRDPQVMTYFPALLDRAESDAVATRIRAHFEHHGFGLWAVEVAGGAPFVGFIGLQWATWEAAFTPCVEIGWRLARDAWGHRYASEGAAEALRYGFDELGLDEIVAMTVPANQRSRRVMDTLGMQRDLDGDFLHPRVPPGSPLREHVLYRLRRPRR